MARPESRRGPHIRDVAARAGVSAATVSRVLNGTAGVAAPKRARVLQAVETLQYRPSVLARSLSLGRTGAIGVIAPFFTHLGTLGRLRGITERAAAEGYDVVIFDVQTLKQRDDALLSFARRDRVDAVVVISVALTDDDVTRLGRDGVPIVLVDVAHPRLSRVAIDDVAGGRLATEHLLGRGHTRIGFVGDTAEDPLRFTASELRLDGYRQALAGRGLAFDEGLVRRGEHGRESARALSAELLARAAPPTAIFAASDLQAIGVLEAAAAIGCGVPDQLAVIGFDDIDFAEILGLTTVRQPLAEIGASAVELLLARLDADDDSDLVELVHPLTLMVRRTA